MPIIKVNQEQKLKEFLYKLDTLNKYGIFLEQI